MLHRVELTTSTVRFIRSAVQPAIRRISSTRHVSGEGSSSVALQDESDKPTSALLYAVDGKREKNEIGTSESFFDTLLEVVENKWDSSPVVALESLEEEALRAGRMQDPKEAADGLGNSNVELTPNLRLRDLVGKEDVFLPANFTIPNDPKLKEKVMRQIRNEQKSKEDVMEMFSRYTVSDGRYGSMLKGLERFAEAWQPVVAKALTEMINTSAPKVYGRFDEGVSYLMRLEPETAAALGIQTVLLHTLTGEKPVRELSRSVGRAVMAEIGYRTLRVIRPGKKAESLAVSELQARKAQEVVSTVKKQLATGSPASVKQQYDLLKTAAEIGSEEVTADNVLVTRVGSRLLALVVEHCKIVMDAEKDEFVPAPGFDIPGGGGFAKGMGKGAKESYAFIHEIRYADNKAKTTKARQIGTLRLSDGLNERLSEDVRFHAMKLTPKYGPMIIPPRDWESPNNGGYLISRARMMRTRPYPLQKTLLESADLKQIYGGLNALGKQPWKINHRVLDLAQTLWDRGGAVAKLISRTDHELLTKEAYFEKRVSEGVPLEDVDREYRKKKVEVTKGNRELHSERCSTWYKFENAKELKDEEELYFPHNMDFRGRAYPMSTHISHVGDDLSRGLLTFAGPQPEIGREGLYWLKIRLANLIGQDKKPLAERIHAADDTMKMAFKAALDPLAEENLEWWATKDDPFQLLATCFEMERILSGGESNAYAQTSSLPVHQDGSCNGLQHYAALGRDGEGGRAVNLVPQETPRDVYTTVLERVKASVKEDAARGNKNAELLLPLLTRKAVKQTVMTSVYGVTAYGAKLQIKKQLKALRGNVEPATLSRIADYAARGTLSSLGDLFKHADETRRWLSGSADAISAAGQPVHWITPMGLPCVQPYVKWQSTCVYSTLQGVRLNRDVTETDRIHRQRQREAFPPNFIHSLDSTHMLMCAARCSEAGLGFSAVHDSFWTFPAHVPMMNRILRESFVDLHSRKLLSELQEHFQLCYPFVDFPDVPEHGHLDLKGVLESDYFFD
ncbi:hypothetical protein NDN08_004006 [Rhodosorus marinus]|uniref:DNA-directed RNA polymerase n=1 Tax=Rhodosorus marinus TaxID=101924 RepID=A0AAV8UK08_9RHOD|nr:hypothetical protein NDN08_004006 [Rhodosorus marinus]